MKAFWGFVNRRWQSRQAVTPLANQLRGATAYQLLTRLSQCLDFPALAQKNWRGCTPGKACAPITDLDSFADVCRQVSELLKKGDGA